MGVRILTAAVGLPLFFLALYAGPIWVLPVILTLAACFAVYELLWRTAFVRSVWLLCVSILGCAAVLTWGCTGMNGQWAVYGVCALCFMTFPPVFAARRADAAGPASDGKPRTGFTQMGAAVFAPLFLGLVFSGIFRIRQMENGVYWVLLPFLFAWETDTCAYFAGRLFGKRKLAPVISPKKTWAGAIGGVLGCTGFTALFVLVLRLAFHVEAAYWPLLLTAVPASVLAQLGDLSFSCLKRESGIKDYGYLIPGHGGILDRCDSVMFTVPLTEVLLALLGGVL